MKMFEARCSWPFHAATTRVLALLLEGPPESLVVSGLVATYKNCNPLHIKTLCGDY